MEFGEYLKRCRLQNAMTQEELVSSLYSYDIEAFEGLDMSTLSRWERGKSMPPPNRIGAIVSFFQSQTGVAVPCIETKDPKSIESGLCIDALESMIGGVRSILHDLSLDTLSADEYRLLPMRYFERREEILDVHQVLYESVNPNFTRVERRQFDQWCMDPRNFFYTLLYKNTFLGLLFALRLKKEPFDSLIALKKRKSDISSSDIADMEESASMYMLSSFSLDKSVSSMLFARFYAHVISHHKSIERIGVVTPRKDVGRLALRMNISFAGNMKKDDDEVIDAYSGTIFDLLSSREAIRMLFPRRGCR